MGVATDIRQASMVWDHFMRAEPDHLHAALSRHQTFLCVVATGPIRQAYFPTCDKVMRESEGTVNVSAA
jgi:hypothetical protein